MKMPGVTPGPARTSVCTYAMYAGSVCTVAPLRSRTKTRTTIEVAVVQRVTTQSQGVNEGLPLCTPSRHAADRAL